MSAILQPLRCLVVEDSEDDARLVLRELRHAGFEVTSERVDTAEAMRDALTRKPWDLVLSDFLMPHFNGLAALEVLQATGLDLPFIIISGSIGEDIAVGAMKAGASSYLMKDRLASLGAIVEHELVNAAERRARKEAEEALGASETLYRSLFEGMLNGFAYCRMLFEDGHPADFIYLTVNPNFEKLTGLGDVTGRKVSEVIPGIREADPELIERYGRVAMTGIPEHFEIRVASLKEWYSVSTFSPKREHFVTVFEVITARKQAEEALRASLQEKDALLKEVHHRVKNNLQVMTSLLRLETSRTAEPGARRVLKDMQGRILSMALLHETLYRTGIFGRVDLANYLQQLAGQLFRAHNAVPGQVVLALNLSSVQADIDQSIPCGLIVNELLANSLKHAFPEGRPGEVSLSLQQDAEGQVRLQVGDTGVGLPDDFEARRTRSLGLQLVSDLARQLGGRLEVGAGPSAEFTVIFAAAAP